MLLISTQHFHKKFNAKNRPFSLFLALNFYNIFTMKYYKKTFTVQKKDIDINGHVNNVRYLEWFLTAATEHSEQLGFSFETLRGMNRTWVAKEHRILYKSSALEEENLILETWLEEIKSAQGVRKYELRNAQSQKVVCEGSTVWVFVELETYRPKRIPDDLVRLYAQALSD